MLSQLTSVAKGTNVHIISILFNKQEFWRVEDGEVIKNLLCPFSIHLLEVVFDGEVVYAMKLPEGNVFINQIPEYLAKSN